MSSPVLRDYQQQLKTDLYDIWDRNVCLVSPTGSGKTVVMSSIAGDQVDPGVAIAHRTELVGQISMAMADNGISHNIIAAANTVKFCISQHVRKYGRSFYDSHGMVTVAAVDTLLSRAPRLVQWAAMQKWWMIDECHHLLQKNKWGRATDLFTNARGVGVTATPIRADRKSLHRIQGGLFDSMIVGPSMRDLIDRRSLCDYRIWAPPQSIDLGGVKIGATGDYVQKGLRDAAHKSRIVGDVVQHYQTLAEGLRGITFTVDVEQAVELAKAFNDAGVPAIAVSAKTPDSVRAEAVRKLRDGKVLQLVNVDLFGEGFDVPAVECVSMARPTMSYGLFVQQFGRALRPLRGKTHGIIIDHVGNVKRHGLPDAPRKWSLLADERGKRGARDMDITPVTTCPACFRAYEAVTPICPFCGYRPEPASRSRIECVDGDLIELDANMLAMMRGEVDRVDGPAQVPFSATPVIEKAVRKRWNERQSAQGELRNHIAIWAGVLRDRGADDHEIYRRFWHSFGTDIITAQTLGAKGAAELAAQIQETWR